MSELNKSSNMVPVYSQPAVADEKGSYAPNIVSTSVFIQKFKESKQSTLTQIFGVNGLYPESSSSESSDSVFETKRKRKETPIVTPKKMVKQKIDQTKNRGPSDQHLAEVGDLITSTARELNHPRWLFGDIDPGFFFGMVLSADPDSVEVAWEKVEPQLQKAKVATKKGERGNEDFRDIKFVGRSLVRVVGKYDDGKLEKMNSFIKAAIFSNFRFKKNVGWVKYRWG